MRNGILLACLLLTHCSLWDQITGHKDEGQCIGFFPVPAQAQATADQMQFLNDSSGFLGARARPNLVYTGNSAASVSARSLPDPPDSFQFLDANQGFAAAGGRVWKTINGGQSWDALPSDASYRSIQFLSTSQGFRTGTEVAANANGTSRYVPVFSVTSDGGASWIRYDTGLSATGLKPFFVTASTGWLVETSDYRTIAKTTDGGASWTTQFYATYSHSSPCYSNPDCKKYNAAFFLDATRGWAAGVRTLMRTTDGTTWTELPTPDQTINVIRFLNATTGYAAGSSILKTFDGGSSWVDMTGSRYSIGTFWLVSDGHIWFTDSRQPTLVFFTANDFASVTSQSVSFVRDTWSLFPYIARCGSIF